MPGRVESFREVNCSEDRPTARAFFQPIRNGLRKEQDLIYSRVDRPGWKPAWRGERMKLDSRKKSRQDRIMQSKSFDTLEVRERGLKEAEESRGFPILWMEDIFQMEGKECEDQERLQI